MSSSNMSNNSYLMGIGILVVGLLAVGAYFYPIAMQNAGSPAGSTFNSAKIAAIAVSLASPGANATSSSVLNTDAGSRFVTGYRYGCTTVGTSQTAYTGTGLASLQLTIGTTSTAAPQAIPGQASNLLVASAIVVSTSTTNAALASSSAQLGNGSLWRSGEYMTFWTNATNTATCTFGVDYLPS